MFIHMYFILHKMVKLLNLIPWEISYNKQSNYITYY